jgi:hypothetical protein
LPSSEAVFGRAPIGRGNSARRFAQALRGVELMDAALSRIGMRDPFEAPA